MSSKSSNSSSTSGRVAGAPNMKYVLVCGGVISGIGKGVISSSIGTLLKSMGHRVTAIKIDPYLNIDASLFSPYEHGEVFVLDDGGEVDLDLGNYERFLDVKLGRDNNITTGKINRNIYVKERRGDYLGKTVQIVPHMTDEIKDWIKRVAQIPVDDSQDVPEICVIELGGTIGDIESGTYVEAFSQFEQDVGSENFCCVHVSLVLNPKSTGEHKTKPTQESVKKLKGLGLDLDLLICRSEDPINQECQEKISRSCRVHRDQVICICDQDSIYKVPIELQNRGLVEYFCKKFEITNRADNDLLHQWRRLVRESDEFTKSVSIAFVGKYTALKDAYASVIKALQHSAFAVNRKLNILYIESSDLEEEMKTENQEAYDAAWNRLRSADGIIVPGGFGDRGVEGKIQAIHHARMEKIPFLGVCLGYQCAVLEICRNGLTSDSGWTNAESAEVNREAERPVIIEMPEHHGGDLGGTMRVGSRPTHFVQTGGILHKLYGSKDIIHERHRHRYEVNPDAVPELEAAGMHFVGRDESGQRMEIMELQDHPYFVGVQFHPEFTSRPLKPSPPYLGLLKAATGELN